MLKNEKLEVAFLRHYYKHKTGDYIMLNLPAGTGDQPPTTKTSSSMLGVSSPKKPTLLLESDKAHQGFAKPSNSVLLDTHVQFKPFPPNEAYAYMNDTGVVKCYKTDRLIAFENAVLRQLPRKKFFYDGPVHLKMTVESERGIESFPFHNFLTVLEDSVLWGVHQINALSMTFKPSKGEAYRSMDLTITKSV